METSNTLYFLPALRLSRPGTGRPEPGRVCRRPNGWPVACRALPGICLSPREGFFRPRRHPARRAGPVGLAWPGRSRPARCPPCAWWCVAVARAWRGRQGCPQGRSVAPDRRSGRRRCAADRRELRHLCERASYNRAAFTQEWAALLAAWYEFLNKPMASNVVPLKTACLQDRHLSGPEARRPARVCHHLARPDHHPITGGSNHG